MQPKLNPLVARYFQLGTTHTVVRIKGRTINLCQLSLSEAKELTAKGDFPYLKRKPRKPRATKAE